MVCGGQNSTEGGGGGEVKGNGVVGRTALRGGGV